MPTTQAELHRAVAAILTSKRLGVPVFVRYQLHSQEPAQAVPERLARAVGAVRSWIGQEIERLYAVGDARNGQVTLTVEFAAGATALVSWARSRADGSGIDLMILGNRGAIYHDAGLASLWDEPATPLADAADRELTARVQRALRSGQPEALRRGAE